MQFVQYPLENPVRPPFAGRWEIYPDLGKVPFLFGKQTIKGNDYFVGVGYSLVGQDFRDGRLQYDGGQADAPFRVYFPYHWYPAGIDFGDQVAGVVRSDDSPIFRSPAYEMSMVVSTAGDQAGLHPRLQAEQRLGAPRRCAGRSMTR